VEGQICDFIAFISKGIIRHYYIKDGNEITCDISIAPAFITDFKSFSTSSPSSYYFQALKPVELRWIKKAELMQMYWRYPNLERLGRIMAEHIAVHTTEQVITLAAHKPEERITKLLETRPELFQMVPQKHLARMIGISPESLSRIVARKSTRGAKS
jgi:CRP/FNR family transcriptional regulator, anaerobic regulatory protein